jgi:hypothetical protein
VAVEESLRWLNLVSARLRELEEFRPANPAERPSDAVAHTGRVVESVIHTRDPDYVQVLRRRFGEIAAQMRAGTVTVLCSSIHQAALGRPTGSRAGSAATAQAPPPPRRSAEGGGSTIIGGTAATRTQVSISGLGVAGGHPRYWAATLIHEYAHAVLPTLGICHRTREGGIEVHDWAYEDERVFDYLTTEEALNNADGYEVIARALATGSDPRTRQQDVVTGLRGEDAVAVRRALAFAQQRLRLCRGFFLESASGPSAPARELIDRHLPGRSNAQLGELGRLLATMYERSMSAETVGYSGGRRRDRALAWSSEAVVTADRVIPRGVRGVHLSVGRPFLDATEEDRIRAMLAIQFATHAGTEWRASARGFSALAAELAQTVLQAPRAGGAAEHLREHERQETELAAATALRNRILEPLRRHDSAGLLSRLRMLQPEERRALELDAEFLGELRRSLSGMSRWVVLMQLRFGGTYPPLVRSLHLALYDRDGGRVARLLQSAPDLRELPGLRDAVEAQVAPGPGLDRLRNWLPRPQPATTR